MGFPFPATVINGNGGLVVPQVQSPNFSTASQTGWQLQQNGDATFYSVTLQGGNVVVFGPNGSVLIYSGVPAAGNLIIALAGQSGTDQYGNTWVEGEQIGIAGQGQLIFQPNVGQTLAFGAATGTVQGSVQGVTTDANQGAPSLFGPVLLNPGTSQVMAQIATSPLLASGGMGIILRSAADDASSAAQISLCTVTLQGANMTFTPMVDIAPNAITMHSTTGPGVQVVVLTSTQTWNAPSNTPSTILAECFGASGGSGGGGGAGAATSGGAGGTGGSGGGGGGGGEYAAEPALAVTGSSGYAATIASGGTAGTAGNGATYTGSPSGNAGSNGGNGGNGSGSTTFAGNSVTVTAHPGSAGGGGGGGPIPFGGSGAAGAAGAGGTGSTNTTHFAGAAGGAGGLGLAESGDEENPGGGGGGGGSSAGTAAIGNAGGAGASGATTGAGGTGGSAPSGGFKGGAGGNGGGGAGVAGNAGSTPSGGAGAGGGGSAGSLSANGFNGGAGKAGARGQIRLTYTPTGSTTQSVTVSLSTGGNVQFVGTDGTTYFTGRQTTVNAGQTVTAQTATPLTNLAASVAASTYHIRALVAFTGTASTAKFSFTGPGASTQLMRDTFVFSGATAFQAFTVNTTYTTAMTSGTLSATVQVWDCDLIVTFTGTGTLVCNCLATTSGDNVTIKAGSFMEVFPCS